MPDVIADSAANSLADYAGRGRGVVLTAFSFAQPRPSLGLGSAIFASGLSPLQGLSIYNTSPGGVNTTAMSTDPACAKITEGVSGPLNSTFANFTYLSKGARTCASYYSGSPAVAVNAAGNVVGYNSFPSAASDQSQASYRRLFGNAVYQACTAESMPPAALAVPLDIKPASCPNTVAIHSKGVLPVAILGTLDVPVTRIDVTSIRLGGAAPLRSNLADVASPYAPFTGKTSCSACTSSGPDGLLDLELKFDLESLAEALPGGQIEACVVLKMTGKLKAEFGGRPDRRRRRRHHQGEVIARPPGLVLGFTGAGSDAKGGWRPQPKESIRRVLRELRIHMEGDRNHDGRQERRKICFPSRSGAL
jgi:hypothetical protein